MNKNVISWACLALAPLGLIAASAVAQQPQPQQSQPQSSTPEPAIDRSIMHVQVILDRLGFSPGVIDGRQGQSLEQALRGFQAARKLTVTGKMDRDTLRALNAWKAIRPTRVLTIPASELAGSFAKLPDDPAAQAKLPELGYAHPLERLAERFHTTPHTLALLNPGARLVAGVGLVVPNALPSSRDYDPELPPAWRKTLSDLNVDAHQPEGARVVVDKSEGVLKVFDKGDRLVAQFPATLGSGRDPLPIGTWKIQGESYNPPFHYNPELFWDVSDSKEKQLLPPGPNGPVGVAWLDLSKPHYGIHGTPHPETIGRAESHGCIRLTNWDVARLSLMVKPGTPAVFQE